MIPVHVILIEWIAYRISKYLTSTSGLTVAFDSAIVPNWKEGKISFTNVSVTRMPRSERQRRRLERDSGVSRLSEMQTTDERIKREAGDKGKARKVIENRKPYGYVMAEAAEAEEEDVDEIVDGGDDNILKQYMWFDVTIESVDVTLSLIRWLDGKGLVKDAEVKGVRGTIGKPFSFYNFLFVASLMYAHVFVLSLILVCMLNNTQIAAMLNGIIRSPGIPWPHAKSTTLGILIWRPFTSMTC